MGLQEGMLNRSRSQHKVWCLLHESSHGVIGSRIPAVQRMLNVTEASVPPREPARCLSRVLNDSRSDYWRLRLDFRAGQDREDIRNVRNVLAVRRSLERTHRRRDPRPLHTFNMSQLTVQDGRLKTRENNEPKSEPRHGIGPARLLGIGLAWVLAILASMAGWDLLLYDYRNSGDAQYALWGAGLLSSGLAIAVAGLSWFAGCAW
jgi:hypothetical protein